MKSHLYKIIILLTCFVNIIAYAQPSVLTDSRYKTMLNDFLHVNPTNFSEIDLGTMSKSSLTSFMNGPSDTIGFRLDELTGAEKWYSYGAKHLCTNSQGKEAACWYSTGGSLGGIFQGNPCGSPTGNNYTIASTDPSILCPGTVKWSSMNYWLNAYDNTDYVDDAFPGAHNMPLNRLCVEMEMPNTGLVLKNAQIAKRPELSQFVNRSIVNPNYQNMSFEWGTYTSPRTDANGKTTNAELGESYQPGGSHFYHKPTAYGAYPADRIFALDKDTFVACIGNIPTGVRSGERPTYAANPLLTLGGDDANGITNAFSYLKYLTRIYFRFASTYDASKGEDTSATYPFDIKINKFWMMYENNDIFAMNHGSVLGQDIVKQGQSAYYPFTLYNFAPQDRTYRLFIAMGGAQPLSSPFAGISLIEDLNNNGKIDAGEPVINPYDTITFKANTNYHFIIKHSVDFTNSYYGVLTAHNRKFAQASLSFIELNRLRSASYAIRTWEGNETTKGDKIKFFNATQYPSDTSAWYKYKQFNADFNPSTNPNLLRNTPDFKRAMNSLPKKTSPPFNIKVQ